MSSFLIRGLARYFAASKMASSSSTSSSTPNTDEVLEGAVAWNKNMRWLIPFVQASGYCIVIENPKSHEKIVINQDTKVFPFLSSEWFNQYSEKDLIEWMAQEKEKEEARRIKEAHGRSRFGDSFKIEE